MTSRLAKQILDYYPKNLVRSDFAEILSVADEKWALVKNQWQRKRPPDNALQIRFVYIANTDVKLLALFKDANKSLDSGSWKKL